MENLVGEVLELSTALGFDETQEIALFGLRQAVASNIYTNVEARKFMVALGAKYIGEGYDE